MLDHAKCGGYTSSINIGFIFTSGKYTTDRRFPTSVSVTPRHCLPLHSMCMIQTGFLIFILCYNMRNDLYSVFWFYFLFPTVPGCMFFLQAHSGFDSVLELINTEMTWNRHIIAFYIIFFCLAYMVIFFQIASLSPSFDAPCLSSPVLFLLLFPPYPSSFSFHSLALFFLLAASHFPSSSAFVFLKCTPSCLSVETYTFGLSITNGNSIAKAVTFPILFCSDNHLQRDHVPDWWVHGYDVVFFSALQSMCALGYTTVL